MEKRCNNLKISKTETQQHQAKGKLWKLETVFRAMLTTFLQLPSFISFPQQLTILSFLRLKILEC